MKKVIFLSFLVFFLSNSFYSFSQSSRMKDRFYVGACNDGNYFYWNLDDKLSQYNDLFFNGNYSLGFHKYWDNDFRIGSFYQPVGQYSTNVINTINYWWGNNNNHLNSLILDRIKVSRPAYGHSARNAFPLRFTCV